MVGRQQIIPKDVAKEIKSYNKDNHCEKCGGSASSKYSTTYIKLNGIVIADYDAVKRRCSNCGFMWDELTD